MSKRINRSKKIKTSFKNKYSMFALLLILLVAIGCSSSKSDKVADKGNDTTKEQTGDETAPTEKKGFSDSDLEDVFKAKKQVGKFKQVKILPSSDDSKKIFRNSTGEALAMYMGNSKKEGVMYVIAAYTSRETAKEEFRNYIDREKQKGAKMIVDVTENPANKSIDATYRKGKVSIISFCSWQIPQVTMCHSMASPDPQTALDFHNSWFGNK